MQRTRSTLAVARELLTRPDDVRWTYEISQSVNLTRGSVNRILKRMAGSEYGWVVGYWQTMTEDVGPQRRLFRVTDKGKLGLAEFVREPGGNNGDGNGNGDGGNHDRTQSAIAS